MPLPTRTVAATFTGRAGATVLFRLLNTVSDGTDIAEAGTQTLATLDGSGVLSQALLCQDPSLDADPVYDWRPIFGFAEWVRGIVVPAGSGSVALASLSPSGAPLTPTQFTQLDEAVTAEATARAAGDAANASSLTAETTRATTAEAGKAATVHTHGEADVTGLTTDLAGKAATAHAHAEADVTGLSTDLAAKADLVAGIIPTAQLPALAINDTFPVASQAAMLALTAQRGDVAIRSDLGKSLVLSADAPTVLANWLELSAAGKVTSVNGQQGVIVLAAADVGADASGAAATAQTAAASDATAKVATETSRATAAEAGKAQKLTRTAVKTANYTASAGDLVPCDTTSVAFTVTLPNAPANGSRVAAKVVTLGAGNAVTIACAGSDVFNKTGGPTTGTLSLLNQALYLQYDAGIWTVIADDLPLSDLDARFAPITGSGAYAPAVEPVNTVAASGSAQTIPNPSTGGNATISRITLTANCTLTLPTATAGASFTLVLVQDGTGSRTVTWPGTVKWAAGTAPTLSTGINKIDYLSFVCTDGTNWAGFVSGLDMR